MNIEECIKILKEFRKYNKIYKEENKDLTITITLEAKESIDKAIETLLTAYENLKSYNKGTKEALRVAEDLEHQANKEAGDWEARCFELEAELEKEKEINKNAICLLKHYNNDFNKMSDNEVKQILYCFDKCANIKKGE